MDKLLLASIIFLSYIVNGVVEKLPEFRGDVPESGTYAVGTVMRLETETLCDGMKVELPVNKDVDFVSFTEDPSRGITWDNGVVYFVVNEPATISYLRVTCFFGLKDPATWKVDWETYVFVGDEK